MLRALKFLLYTAVFLALAWWIGNLPGTLTAVSGPYTVTTSVPAAILILSLIALLLAVLLRALGGLRRAPGGFGAWRGSRRRQAGELALQRGIVALAAEDFAAARAQAARARALLGETPLVLMLCADAARLAGDSAAANADYAKLTRHKDMAFLGHRGLLTHHFEAGELEQAQTHAYAAADTYPASAWTRQKRLQLAARRGDYVAALALTREKREVAALATAAAQTATDKRSALRLARQAVRADGALAPAVLALAQALRANAKPRAARRALLEGWKRAPAPQLAEAFLAPIPTPLERARAAAELAAAHPGHAQSELVLAQTALAARLTGEARRHAQAALAAGAAEAAGILAALEGGPAPVPAAPAFACGACQAEAPSWAPICPACGRIGTLAQHVAKTPGTALA